MIARGSITAAILAGGLGTRLRSVVTDRPKVLAPVRGRPWITYLLDQLADAGLREVVLLSGYRAGQLEATLGEAYRGLRLVYSPEPEPLGTAGALRHASHLLSTPQVLLLNGDSYIDVNLVAFLQLHAQRAGAVSLVLAHRADTARYGRVQLTADSRITAFAEKQPGSDGWINAGVYLFDRARIDEIPADRPVSLEREMFPSWLARGELFGFRCTGSFLDIGTPESYLRAADFFGASAPLGAGDIDTRQALGVQ
jgi:NDP-sugar pyrophosphorylase family protein